MLRDFLIKKILPKTVRINNGILEINPDDAVISGALTFGTYEISETEIFKSCLKPGMTVVDVGANIGYYTVMAALAIGNNGHVIAYEPAPENFSFLKSNISLNKLSNVIAVQKALSDHSGIETLYLTENNKGTHSFANNRKVKKSITVPTDTLDNSLEKMGTEHVDIIKMDVEGAEPMVISGMDKTLSQNPDVIIFMEFYPLAITRLGHKPIDLLDKLSRRGFHIWIIDENKKSPVRLGAADFDPFIKKFPRGERIVNMCISRNPIWFS